MRGRRTTKEGYVKAHIPAGTTPWTNGWSPKPAQSWGSARRHHSYLIGVLTDPAGERVRWYWPRVSQLVAVRAGCAKCGRSKQEHHAFVSQKLDTVAPGTSK